VTSLRSKLKGNGRGSSLSLLLRCSQTLLLAREQRAYLVLLLLSPGLACLEAAGIGLVLPMLNVAMTASSSSTPLSNALPFVDTSGSSTGILVLAGLVAFVFIVKSIAALWLLRRTFRFTTGLYAALSGRMFDHYLHQPIASHSERNSADLLRNCTEEVSHFTYGVVGNSLSLACDVLIALSIAGVCLWAEPLLSSAALAALLGTATVVYLVTEGRLRGLSQERSMLDARRVQDLQEGFGSVREISLLHAQELFVRGYRARVAGLATVASSVQIFTQLPRVILELVVVLGTVGVVSMAASADRMTELAPVLGLFVAATLRLAPTVHRITSACQLLRFSASSAMRLHAESTSCPKPADPERRQVPAGNWSRVIVENVCFQYPSAVEPLLRSVTMSVARGERVAICGSSGAGKSTLVDLFLGLRLPDQGRIMVDSINLRDCRVAWQQRIGYLPQTIALCDASVLANVALGEPAEVVDADRAWQALSATGLAALVSSLPSGIYSPIGERGGRLSGGQRQRLGLARALYRRPDVLVLDEPTSALDPASRDEILECLGSTMEGVTMLIISHDIEVLKLCQRKLELRGGVLVGCEEFQSGEEA